MNKFDRENKGVPSPNDLSGNSTVVVTSGAADATVNQIYTPLSISNDEFRLIELLPSALFDSPIACQLVHASLQSPPRYEALSYVWGPPPFTSSIKVSTSPNFPIGENLELALRYLRLPSEKRIIWVDALCINQADVDERSQQVRRMKEIFTLCDTVLVYLGPYPSELDRSPRRLEDLRSRDSSLDPVKVFKEELEARSKSLQGGLDVMEKISDKDILTLKGMEESMERNRRPRREEKGGWLLSSAQVRFLKRVFRYSPIWKRVWIMQEICSGRRVMLVGGTASLNWEKVSSFLGNTVYADAFHETFGHGWVGKLGTETFCNPQIVEHQRGVQMDLDHGFVSTLLDVLTRFREMEATDPRDKIYGLLSLVSEKHPLSPDYNRTYQEVFTDVAIFLINSSENLDILCQSAWSEIQNPESIGLPSWVPDFTSSGHIVPLFAQRSIFSAGAATCKLPCKIIGNGTLALTGIKLGKVGAILPEFISHQENIDVPFRNRKDDQHTPYQILPRKWMQQYFGSKLLDEANFLYATGESSLTAYWRTLLASCTAFPIKRLSEGEILEYGKTFASVLRGNLAEEELRRQDYWQMLERMLRSWTFAMTTDGLYSMVLSHVKEGDLIVVLHGAKVPVVLRPAGHSMAMEEKVKYRVVSTAYVHGFMDGEAMDWVKEGRRDEESFLLV